MFDIHQNFKRTVVLAFSKADGTPGVVEGIPAWSMAPAETSVLTVAEDGMSADIVWAGTGDGAVLTVVADGDLGTGVFPIVVTDTFNFIQPLGATFGTISISDEVPV